MYCAVHGDVHLSPPGPSPLSFARFFLRRTACEMRLGRRGRLILFFFPFLSYSFLAQMAQTISVLAFAIVYVEGLQGRLITSVLWTV